MDSGKNEITMDARKAMNEYKREWRKKNPDKVKAAQARYWEKRAKQLQEVKENEANEDNR